MPHELTKNRKNRHFEVPSSLTVHNKEKSFDQIVMCNEKWIVYDNQRRPTWWLDWDAPKHFPKPTLHQKKVMVTVWWSATCLIHHSFLNPDETITSEKYAQQMNEMHWKTANACSQHWSIERAQFFSTTTPDCTLHNQHFRSWIKFCLICHIHLTSHQPTTMHPDNFLQGKSFHDQQDPENAFQEFTESQSMEFLCYRNKRNLTLIGKKVLILMVPILINKDLFEPSC